MIYFYTAIIIPLYTFFFLNTEKKNLMNLQWFEAFNFDILMVFFYNLEISSNSII